VSNTFGETLHIPSSDYCRFCYKLKPKQGEALAINPDALCTCRAASQESAPTPAPPRERYFNGNGVEEFPTIVGASFTVDADGKSPYHVGTIPDDSPSTFSHDWNVGYNDGCRDAAENVMRNVRADQEALAAKWEQQAASIGFEGACTANHFRAEDIKQCAAELRALAKQQGGAR
jgi:hypothetical protein